ncbi:cation efflux family domain-containing protein [Rhizoctonia solani AG-1 IA]|uniref:Cation efflux family domain-containing protein n=1 Tax=Thanatephorus cucumeris (strain AG1-IA) TaxID=983506 RepID=L8WZE5_THACA|nr:cation efflux family domain-containing protein [Rhizoctonia solani AG-1 IA]
MGIRMVTTGTRITVTMGIRTITTRIHKTATTGIHMIQTTGTRTTAAMDIHTMEMALMATRMTNTVMDLLHYTCRPAIPHPLLVPYFPLPCPSCQRTCVRPRLPLLLPPIPTIATLMAIMMVEPITTSMTTDKVIICEGCFCMSWRVVPLVIDCAKVLSLDVGERETSIRQALIELSNVDGLASYSAPRFWPKDGESLVGSIHIQLAPSASSYDPAGAHRAQRVTYANADRVVDRVEQLLRARIHGLHDLTIQVEGSRDQPWCSCLNDLGAGRGI